MRGMFVIAGILSLFAAGSATAQQNLPDLKGTWTGTGDAVFVTTPGSSTDARFGSVPITLVIVAQQDRRFGGTITMTGASRPIVGVITFDDKIRWSEPGGFVEGALTDANTFQGCFVRVSAFTHLAACETLTRQQ